MSAITPSRRVTGKFKSLECGATSPPQSQRPAHAPSAIAAICPNDPTKKTTIAIAASAMPARAIGREGSRHAPDGLCDDRDSDELEAVQETLSNRSRECGCAHRKGEQDQRGGHGEGKPRRKADLRTRTPSP